MKCDIFLKRHLNESCETVSAFARRAGVHRSTVYRALAGHNLRLEVIDKLVVAAGGQMVIVDAKAKVMTQPEAVSV